MKELNNLYSIAKSVMFKLGRVTLLAIAWAGMGVLATAQTNPFVDFIRDYN